MSRNRHTIIVFNNWKSMHINLKENKKNLFWIIAVYLFLSVLLIISGYIYNTNQSKKLKTEIHKQLSAFANLKEDQLVNWRKERLADADFFFQNQDFFNSVKRTINNPAKKNIDNVKNWLVPLQENHDYRNIILSSLDGQVICSVGDSLFFNSLNHAVFSVIEEKQTKVIDLHKDDLTNFIHMTCVVPLIDKQSTGKNVIAILVFIIDPRQTLYPVIEQWPIPSRSAETVLFRLDGDDILFLNTLNNPTETALTLRLPVSTQKLPAAMGLRGKSGPVEGIDYRGKEVLADVRKIPNSQWYMVNKVDRAEIYAPLSVEESYISIFIILFLFIGGSLTILVWYRQQTSFYKKSYFFELEKKALTEHLDYLTKFANDIIILFDSNLDVVDANEKAVSYYGYSLEEFKSLSARSLRSKQSIHTLDKAIKDVEANTSSVYETVHKKKDGSEFFAEISMRKLNIEGYKFYQSIIRNVTERKESQDQIIHLNRIYSVLSNINQTIVREKNKSKLFEEVCRIAVEDGNFLLAWIGLFDESNRFTPVVHYQKDDGFIKEHSISILEAPVLNGPVGKVIRDGNYVICSDVANDLEAGPKRNEVLKSGIRSYINLPIKPNGEVIGTLNLYSHSTKYFTDEEIKLLEEVTIDLSFAVKNIERDKEKEIADNTLKENQRMLSTLMGNLPGMVYRCLNDANWTMKFVSDGCFELTGYKPDMLIDNKILSYSDLIHPDDRNMVWETVQESLQRKVHFSLIYRINTKDGIEKWIWENGAGVYGSYDNLIALEGFISDITHRKLAEDELIKAKEAAERSDRLKTEFLAQMSHEIRTPLNAILNFSQLIEDELLDKFDDEVKSIFENLDSASNRIIRTVDLLLNTSELHAGSYNYTPRKFDLYNQTLVYLYNEYKNEATKKSIDFILTKETNKTKVFADDYSVTQIYSNLISNAIKYTDHGKVEIIIRRNEENKLVVIIADTGIGISQEALNIIFEPFRQEDQGYTRKYEGTGLGLYLVKEYSNLNGISLNFKTAKGKGTTVTTVFS